MSSYGDSGARRGGFRGERYRQAEGQTGFRGDYRQPRRPNGNSGIDYQGLVEFVAKAVAEKPEEVFVSTLDRGRGAIAVKIKMADEDLGRLIGRSGRNIEALRTLVKASSLRERRKVFVDIKTPRPED